MGVGVLYAINAGVLDIAVGRCAATDTASVSLQECLPPNKLYHNKSHAAWCVITEAVPTRWAAEQARTAPRGIAVARTRYTPEAIGVTGRSVIRPSGYRSAARSPRHRHFTEEQRLGLTTTAGIWRPGTGPRGARGAVRLWSRTSPPMMFPRRWGGLF